MSSDTANLATTPEQAPASGNRKRRSSVGTPSTLPVDVKRLVEYFLVVSCVPNWERNPQPPVPPGETSSPRTPQRRRTGAVAEEQEANPPSSILQSAKKIRKSIKKQFRPKEASGAELAIEATSSLEDVDSVASSSQSESLPAPKPRGQWTREKEDFGEEKKSEGNIHVPHSEMNTFKPKLTARYPLEDYSDNPLNPMVTQFCFPAGEVIVPSKEYHMPRVHHFVLTNETGRKIYGTCLTIYEEYLPEDDDPWRRQDLVHSDSGETDIEITVEASASILYVPKCLAILSFWPYVQAFREYLAQLYRLATLTDVMKTPIERYVMNVCMEIPAPPPGAFEVQVNILDSVIRFWSPPAQLPIAYVALPYRTLFECLDIENILHVWYCLVMERKVLFISSQHSILTVCAEVLCSLLFPMQWSHLYVPLLPRFLSAMLDAPVPYLCGVAREHWLHVQQFVHEETIIVDLDRNTVLFGKATPPLPPVPARLWKKLRKAVEANTGRIFWATRGLEEEYKQFSSKKLHQRKFKQIGRQKGDIRWNERLEQMDMAFNLQFTPDSDNIVDAESVEREQSQWDSLQEAFLRFFVSLFKDYRQYLKMPKENEPFSPPPGSADWIQWSQRRSFDHKAFVDSQKEEHKPFLSELCMTQQFDDFITKRLYTPTLPDLTFFDQSIDAKLNRSKLKIKKVDTPFLESAKVHKKLQVFHAVAPSTEELPAEFSGDADFRVKYDAWPETFENDFFVQPRPIPSIITAEFDRQSSLRSSLQAMSPLHQHPVKFDYTDYDESPESMSFSVFFYVYCLVIGQEWQEYQRKRSEMQQGDKSLAAEPQPQEGDNSRLNESVELQLESAMDGTTLGLCDSCPPSLSSMNQAVAFLSVARSDLNTQAQRALDLLTAMGGQAEEPQGASLLDTEEEFAEFEEAREVAIAQLDLAFDALKLMEMRGLVPDPDMFKSLMAACGRCGDTKRAVELIQMMKREGLVPDTEVMSAFMVAYALDGGTNTPNPVLSPRSSDAYALILRRRFNIHPDDRSSPDLGETPFSEDDSESDFFSDSSFLSDQSPTKEAGSGSALGAPHVPSAILEWFTPRKAPVKRKKRRRKRRHRSKNLSMSDRLRKQLELGESLLEFLYPGLRVDTRSETCPKCSKDLTENEIVTGWTPNDADGLTTSCPSCHDRFVPHFTVSCSSPSFVGSQGPGTPLYCEYLSPWVLRKELSNILSLKGGLDVIMDPEWRSGADIQATMWWNMIAMCTRYGLPYLFLLQGSFPHNRLINPTPGG